MKATLTADGNGAIGKPKPCQFQALAALLASVGQSCTQHQTKTLLLKRESLRSAPALGPAKGLPWVESLAMFVDASWFKPTLTSWKINRHENTCLYLFF